MTIHQKAHSRKDKTRSAAPESRGSARSCAAVCSVPEIAATPADSAILEKIGMLQKNYGNQATAKILCDRGGAPAATAFPEPLLLRKEEPPKPFPKITPKDGSLRPDKFYIEIEELEDGVPYRDGKDPVVVQRQGKELLVSFTGKLKGHPAAALPTEKGLEFDWMTAGGSEAYLLIAFSEKKATVEALKKSETFMVDREGLISDLIYSDVFERNRKKPGHAIHQYPGLLRVESIASGPGNRIVTYSMPGGMIKIVFNTARDYELESTFVTKEGGKMELVTKSIPIRGSLKIVDQSGNVILETGSGKGFRQARDILIDESGKGTITLETAGGKFKKLPVDLKKPPESDAMENLAEADFAAHDALEKELISKGIRLAEEGRLLATDTLKLLKTLADGLPDAIKDKIKKDNLTVKFTVAEETMESSAGTTEAVIGGQTGAEKGAAEVERETVIHEFTHLLFEQLGLAISGIKPEDVVAGSAMEKEITAYEKKTQIKDRNTALEALSTDAELNALWLGFMDDLDKGEIPKFTRPKERTAKIIDLCDEGNYPGGKGGHPVDKVTEFAASFVSMALLRKDLFVKAVKAARSGGGEVAGLFKKSWDLLVKKGFALGDNPF